MSETRFERAIAAIDARNAGDPNTLLVRGEVRPKELAHATLVTGWVRRLKPHAGEALLLAARAHHIRRWEIARGEYPAGRAGYLAWRRALQDLHAREIRTILAAEGYPEELIGRAEHIVRKRDLARDADVQVLEDALCLTFLETQFAELAGRLAEATMIEVLRKTLGKMSAAAIELAGELDLPEGARSLLLRAAAAP
jgi:hypothetical protein